MPEYWDLWRRDREIWAAVVDRISQGVLPVISRVDDRFPGTALLPNRWDVPGFDVVIPPGGDDYADGAWRTVQVYADMEQLVPRLQFGGAAWFDEQGVEPSEPWKRWWCHTTPGDESRWQAELTDVNDTSVPGRVERNLAELVDRVLKWRWVYDERTWVGEELVREDVRLYSSVEPGREL